jgi:hypothetical protein
MTDDELIAAVDALCEQLEPISDDHLPDCYLAIQAMVVRVRNALASGRRKPTSLRLTLTARFQRLQRLHERARVIALAIPEEELMEGERPGSVVTLHRLKVSGL